MRNLGNLEKRAEEVLALMESLGMDVSEETASHVDHLKKLQASEKTHAAVVVKVESAEESRELYRRLAYKPTINGKIVAEAEFFQEGDFPKVLGNVFLNAEFVELEEGNAMRMAHTYTTVAKLPEVIEVKEGAVGGFDLSEEEMLEGIKRVLGFESGEEEIENEIEEAMEDVESKYMLTIWDKETKEYSNEFVSVDVPLDEEEGMEGFYRMFLDSKPNAVITNIFEIF